MADDFSRARAVIDLDSIAHNAAELQRLAGDAELMAVVKADAYGHGALPVARRLRESHVRWLGVALPSEAVALRAAGDTGNVLCWLWVPGDSDIDACIELGVDIGVGSIAHLEYVIARAKVLGANVRVHMTVDTGLSRHGIAPGEWEHAITVALSAAHIELVGIWSHLASADEPEVATTADQIAVFDACVGVARALGADPNCVHLANTAGILSHSASHFTMVRSGIGIYGVSPGDGIGAPEQFGLRPAMSIEARLAHVKTIPAGAGVGYNHIWVADVPTRVGLVPMGYADGLPRPTTGVHVLIHGVPRAIIGRIAMDQFVVDLGDIPAEIGDHVQVLGHGALDAQELGRAAGTIGYEVVTRIGSRLPRHYVG